MLNKKEINKLRENAKVHKEIFEAILKTCKNWTKAVEINKLCWDIAAKHGVLCWFKWVYWFPANVCISVNNVVVHWLPRKWLTFYDWDLVTFDLWIKDKEYWVNTDAAISFIIGWNSKNKIWAKLIEVNKKALYAWIKQAKKWNKVWDISNAIQNEIEKAWFYVVKDLTWHAVGKELHEKPYIPNFWKKWVGVELKEWMVLAIEPIVWESSGEIYDEWDWEIYIEDGSLGAQYEHTILITDWEPEIII